MEIDTSTRSPTLDYCYEGSHAGLRNTGCRPRCSEYGTEVLSDSNIVYSAIFMSPNVHMVFASKLLKNALIFCCLQYAPQIKMIYNSTCAFNLKTKMKTKM